MICNKCNTEFEDELESCPNCGEPVEYVELTTMDKIKNWFGSLLDEQHKSYTIGVVALFVVCLLSSLFYFNNQFEQNYTRNYLKIDTIVTQSNETMINGVLCDKVIVNNSDDVKYLSDFKDKLNKQKNDLTELLDKFSDIKPPTSYKEQHNATVKLLQSEISLTDSLISFTNMMLDKHSTGHEWDAIHENVKNNIESIIFNREVLVQARLVKANGIDMNQLMQNLMTTVDKEDNIRQARKEKLKAYKAFFGKMDNLISRYNTINSRFNNMASSVGRGGKMYSTLFNEIIEIKISCGTLRGELHKMNDKLDISYLKNDLAEIASDTFSACGTYYSTVELDQHNYRQNAISEYNKAEKAKANINSDYQIFIQKYNSKKQMCLSDN